MNGGLWVAWWIQAVLTTRFAWRAWTGFYDTQFGGAR